MWMFATIAVIAALERPPLWITVEVVNQALDGHSILHLEDWVGAAKRRDVRSASLPRALVVFSALRSECRRPQNGLCEQVAELSTSFGDEVIFVGVLMARQDEAARARLEIPLMGFPFPVAVDPQGLALHALQIDRPGVFVVLDAAGEAVRVVLPGDAGDLAARRRGLRAVRGALRAMLARDQDSQP